LLCARKTSIGCSFKTKPGSLPQRRARRTTKRECPQLAQLLRAAYGSFVLDSGLSRATPSRRAPNCQLRGRCRQRANGSRCGASA
jgi:hypothetical protein